MHGKPERQLQAAGATDIGLVRKHNEDYYSFDEQLGLYLVADGMGGHDSGEVASRTASESITDFLYEYDFDDAEDESDDATIADVSDAPELVSSFNVLQQAVSMANERIYMLNRERGHRDGVGMGTTLVGLWTPYGLDGPGYIFHVGDSRLYRYRNKEFTRMTTDHTLYEQWLEMGGVGQAPQRNVVMRALGPWAQVQVDIRETDVFPGDVFLLCSDGLTGMVDDEDIHAAVDAAKEDGEDMDGTCMRLIELAKAGGGRDNVTVVLVRGVG